MARLDLKPLPQSRVILWRPADAAAFPALERYSVLNKFVAGNEVEREPLRDFAKGEIFFQGLRLIGSGTGLRRLLIAAETARPQPKSAARD